MNGNVTEGRKKEKKKDAEGKNYGYRGAEKKCQ